MINTEQILLVTVFTNTTFSTALDNKNKLHYKIPLKVSVKLKVKRQNIISYKLPGATETTCISSTGEYWCANARTRPAPRSSLQHRRGKEVTLMPKLGC